MDLQKLMSTKPAFLGKDNSHLLVPIRHRREVDRMGRTFILVACGNLSSLHVHELPSSKMVQELLLCSKSIEVMLDFRTATCITEILGHLNPCFGVHIRPHQSSIEAEDRDGSSQAANRLHETTLQRKKNLSEPA